MTAATALTELQRQTLLLYGRGRTDEFIATALGAPLASVADTIDRFAGRDEARAREVAMSRAQAIDAEPGTTPPRPAQPAAKFDLLGRAAASDDHATRALGEHVAELIRDLWARLRAEEAAT